MILVTVTGPALLFLSGCCGLSPCWFGLCTWFPFPGRAVASLRPDEVKHSDHKFGKGLEAVESQSLFANKQNFCTQEICQWGWWKLSYLSEGQQYFKRTKIHGVLEWAQTWDCDSGYDKSRVTSKNPWKCCPWHKQGQDFSLQNSADAYVVRRLKYKAFHFVLSIPLVECNIWLTFLLDRGLPTEQTLVIIILPSPNSLIWQADLSVFWGITKVCFLFP